MDMNYAVIRIKILSLFLCYSSEQEIKMHGILFKNDDPNNVVNKDMIKFISNIKYNRKEVLNWKGTD